MNETGRTRLIIENFTQGLAEELSKEGACDRAIFPDTEIVIDRCTMKGNLTVEGVSKHLIHHHRCLQNV